MAPRKLLDLIHPGEILSEEFMEPMGISLSKLARDIGVPPGRVSAIVKGKRTIRLTPRSDWQSISPSPPSSGWDFRPIMI